MHISPLARRLPRDFKNNLGKYLGIFGLLVMAVTFTSGFLVSAYSIADIAAGMREAYNIEDLYFVTMYEATDEALDAVEDLGARVYPNFSRDVPLSLGAANKSTDKSTAEAAADAAEGAGKGAAEGAGKDMLVRLYKNRDGSFDGVAYAQGRAPRAAGEVALDRVFCANHNLGLGDTVRIANEDFELVGICTLSDYQATYKNADDFMFNATTFTVAQLTNEEWERLVGDGATYRYSVLIDDRTMDLTGRTTFEEDLVDAVNDNGSTVSDLMDRESNIGLTFAADDVEGDSTMWETLMLVLIVIMAFVFVVLTDATIEQESAVIGTLLASGYRKRELVAHYMVLPTLIGLAGCTLGFALGNTLMAEPMQGLYYNSYSFPPYVATWHPRVLVITTVVPFCLLVVITLLGLLRKLGATPLQFLRGEASAKARRGGMRLPERLGFVARFRLRVFLRNLSHFVTLFFGIMFGSLLLLMGLALLPVVSINADLMADSVPAEHLYALKAPLKLDATQSERDAWAAMFELSTNPVYAGLDLDLLSDAVDKLEEMGVDLGDMPGLDGADADGSGKGSDKGDGAAKGAAGSSGASDGAAKDAGDATSNASEFTLPPQIEAMVEDSAKHRNWRADDPAIHALWKQVAQAAGIHLKGNDGDLTELIRTLDKFHVQLHALGDDEAKAAWELLQDLMEAAEDESVDLGSLKDPVNQTAIDDETLKQVEKFSVATLQVPRRIGDSTEAVTVYGIEPGSRYWTYADVRNGHIVAGEGLFSKCNVEPGESFTALDRSTNKTYELAVDDACNNGCDLNIYMSVDDFNKLFNKSADEFNGYASNVALPLDERYVASDLTPDKMRSMADQMQDSMGQIMTLIVCMVIPIYVVLIYLLTKTVIDRSARAISYMKVFGYRDREIDRLYMRTITFTVVFSLVVNIPILVELFKLLLTYMMADYSGNFVIELPMSLMAREVGIGFLTYLVVACLHMRAIRKVSLSLALKVQE
ncbi:MAG: hypothetical protein IKG21_00765 [Atopobiaceae bacterium]|nr:hypothetical protein [Atopobiaceae bacterium]